MSGFDVHGRVPVQPEPDEAVEISSPGAWGFVFGLMHLALGGVAVAVAVDEDFAAGKAAFASDAWRWILGGVGAVLAFLAIRGLVRAAGARTRALTPDVRRSARRRGLVLALVGAWLFATAVFDDLARETIAFDSWAQPLFAAGGIYLALMGLSMQLDPTGPLRRQRLQQGYGDAGVATILRASDTGVTVNDAPQVQVDFEIDAGGRTFEASERVVLEQAKLALLIPGSTMNVLVDRGDPRVIHVDWNTWRGPQRAEPPS
ncbi:MAG: hypothetical protein M3323_05855 [Actinomycetota bacterium]|nr:hypothetical protein [Actinomycetota bacterium]